MLAQPFEHQSKTQLFLLARCEDDYCSFAASVFMLLVTRKCKKSHVPSKLITVKSGRNKQNRCKILSKIILSKSTNYNAGNSPILFFYISKVFWQHDVNTKQNMLPMNECSITITWFYGFSSKPILTVQHLFLLNDVFPKILTTYSSYTSLVVLYLGLV